MSAPTVVAFDLSLTSTGVADRNGTRLISPLGAGPKRLRGIRDAVLHSSHVGNEFGSGKRCLETPACAAVLRYGRHPDLVVIEGYSYASGNKAHDVGELGGVVRLALYEAGIRYEVVAPKTLKTYACDNGNASKDDMLLAAVRRLGYAGKSKDEADALWLYALAMHALGSPVVDVPKTHLRALKALPWTVVDLTRPLVVDSGLCLGDEETLTVRRDQVIGL